MQFDNLREVIPGIEKSKLPCTEKNILPKSMYIVIPTIQAKLDWLLLFRLPFNFMQTVASVTDQTK